MDDPFEGAAKFGGKVSSLDQFDPFAGAAKFGGTAPDYGTPASRAAAMMIRPINAQAALDTIGGALKEAPGVVSDYAVGGLKGLGRMASPVLKAIGVQPAQDYSDAALAPSNTVQSVGGAAADAGATGLALAAGAGLLPAAVTRVALSPGVMGAATTAYGLVKGHSPLRSVVEGAGVATGNSILGKALGAVLASRGIPEAEAIASEVAPKVLDEVLPEATVSAKAAIKAKNMERITAEREAFWKAHPKPEATAPAQTAPIGPENPLPKMEGNFPEITPEMQAEIDRQLAPGGKYGRGRIAPIPPNKLPPVLPDPVIPEKIPTRDVVEAKPAFPGQQGARGATNARFDDIAQRTVQGWMKSGKTDSFIKGKLVDMFKMSPEDAADLLRKVSK